MERSSRTQMWTHFLTKKGFHMSSRLRTRLNKMDLLKGRTGLLLRWQERCLMSTRLQNTFGQKRLRQLVMQQIAYLHKLLGKTAYELLTSNKPQVGYFQVFSSKCTFLISIIVLNLLLNLMRDFYLVTAQTLTLTVYTTISPERLKRW